MKYSEIIRGVMEGNIQTSAICDEFNSRRRKEFLIPQHDGREWSDCCARCPMFEFYTAAMDYTDKECDDFCESDDYVNLRWELIYDLESIGD